MEVHYFWTVEQNLASLPEGFDVCVVHDPQPMAIPYLLGEDRDRVAKKWIWRCHIDCADPHPQIWGFIKQFLEPYDAMVFTMKEFVQPEVPGDRVVVSAPVDRPDVAEELGTCENVTVTDICRQYHIDVRRPIMAQISRFDPWKDPDGVIEAYKTVKEQIPEVQLVLAGSLAHDDPEGLRIYDELVRRARRRCRPVDPVQLPAGREHDDQRVPARSGRRHPEVDPRGVRSDRRRSRMEGQARARRAAPAASRCRSRTDAPDSSSSPSRSARSDRSSCSTHPDRAQDDGRSRAGADPRALPDDTRARATG